ncbi:hypothetical protein AVEN_253269-1 [Araneus ventricosus]|uniref:Uncharacterized protein n=1 Tax=Araneus ventricosus TaxID=182803 RepID=A0A4Y2SIL8_ARAVE|nr:hypothetical protein AVEN_253269-1 [Araneus ventricosus]
MSWFLIHDRQTPARIGVMCLGRANINFTGSPPMPLYGHTTSEAPAPEWSGVMVFGRAEYSTEHLNVIPFGVWFPLLIRQHHPWSGRHEYLEGLNICKPRPLAVMPFIMVSLTIDPRCSKWVNLIGLRIYCLTHSIHF